jgi:hypothetical protein
MSVPQSVPVWEVEPVELVRRAVRDDYRTNTGGWTGINHYGLSELTYYSGGVQARIGGPDGVRSYQWTWEQLDAGKAGTRVPWPRFSPWSAKDLRARAEAGE